MPPPLRHRRLRQAAPTATPAAHRCQISRPGRLLRLLPRRRRLPGLALAMSCCSVGQGWVTEGRDGRHCCWRQIELAGRMGDICSSHGADGTSCETAVSPCGELAALLSALHCQPPGLDVQPRSSVSSVCLSRRQSDVRLLTRLVGTSAEPPSAASSRVLQQFNQLARMPTP